MSNTGKNSIALTFAAVLIYMNAGGAAAQSTPAPYPRMAPLEQYRMASQGEEIALARSAAPPPIAANAEVLTLGAHGYDTAVQGTNGFVCMVERAWASDFASTDFWNPRVRAPLCFNAAAVRSVLPAYLQRTQWVLAGLSKSELLDRTHAARAAGRINPPEPGSMCYMLSKGGYLNDAAHGPWHPHVMFFVPRTSPEAWGANVTGGAVYASSDDAEAVTIFMVPVPKWSDGTDATMGDH